MFPFTRSLRLSIIDRIRNSAVFVPPRLISHGIDTICRPDPPEPFSDHGDNLELLKRRIGVQNLTNDQKLTFESITSGKDTFVCGQAGSGKSTGYLLALAYYLISREPIYSNPPGLKTLYHSPRVILLAPTFALAENLFEKLMTLLPRSNSWLIKGKRDQRVPHGPNPEVFVGTPLQLVYITRGFNTSVREVVLNRTEMVIFDEADATLGHFCGKTLAAEFRYGIRTYPDYYVTKNPDECFRRELQRVYVCTGHIINENTRDPSVFEIPEKYMNAPSVIVDKSVIALSPKIEHFFEYFKSYNDKLLYLFQLINTLSQEDLSENRIIIFCRSDSRIIKLWKQIDKYILQNELHEKINLDLVDRLERGSIDSIRSYTTPLVPTHSHYKVRILIASDIYSRGIDFLGVSTVIHFDFAVTIKNYLHRCGRTGRFGQKGKSINLTLESERGFSESIIKFLELENSRLHIDHQRTPLKE